MSFIFLLAATNASLFLPSLLLPNLRKRIFLSAILHMPIIMDHASLQPELLHLHLSFVLKLPDLFVIAVLVAITIMLMMSHCAHFFGLAAAWFASSPRLCGDELNQMRVDKVRKELQGSSGVVVPAYASSYEYQTSENMMMQDD
jgi:hypothetical protein